MIKLVRVSKDLYLNITEIKTVSVTPNFLMISTKGSGVYEVRIGSGYYKLAKKALNI